MTSVQKCRMLACMFGRSCMHARRTRPAKTHYTPDEPFKGKTYRGYGDRSLDFPHKVNRNTCHGLLRHLRRSRRFKYRPSNHISTKQAQTHPKASGKLKRSSSSNSVIPANTRLTFPITVSYEPTRPSRQITDTKNLVLPPWLEC